MPIQSSPSPLDPSLEVEECEIDGAPGARYYYVAMTDAAVEAGVVGGLNPPLFGGEGAFRFGTLVGD